jgi:hypothetical protein
MKVLLKRLQDIGALSIIDASQTPTPSDRAEALRTLGYIE